MSNEFAQPLPSGESAKAENEFEAPVFSQEASLGLSDINSIDVSPTTGNLLDELYQIITDRIIIDPNEAVAAVLWIVHTYVFRSFDHTPRLFVTSQMPACGKSQFLKLLANLSDGGIKLENGTTLPVIRDMVKSKKQATLCLDQMDGTTPEDKRLLNLLCSSFEVGSKVGVKQKVILKNKEVHDSDVFEIGFPIALGKIGGIPDPALMSRMITVRLFPETEEQRLQQMPARQQKLDYAEIRGRIREWVKGINVRYRNPPKGVPSRTADGWQAMLAVAKLGVPIWVQRAHAAIIGLLEEEFQTDTPGIRILRRLYIAVLVNENQDFILGKEVDGIVKSENFTPVQRSKLLSGIGLKSVHRHDGRGYERQAILKLAKAYKLDQSEDPSTET